MKFMVSRTGGGQPPCDGAYTEAVTRIYRGVKRDGTITETPREIEYWFVDLAWEDLEQFVSQHQLVFIECLPQGNFGIEIVDGDLD